IPGSALRVVGLSGLGKTRLALEALRPASSQDAVSAATVYFDAAHNESALRHEVSEGRRLGLGGILVVDNCPAALHMSLQAEVSAPNARLSLLTLDLNPGEHLRGTRAFKLNPSDIDHVKRAVMKIAPSIREDDAQKIASLSSGFVYFGLLLTKAW